MRRRNRRFSTLEEPGEGFIDVLFLLLTFFIVQNVWQISLADAQNRFVHAQKLDFVRAPDGPAQASGAPEGRVLKILVEKDRVLFDKGEIVARAETVFPSGLETKGKSVERAVFEAVGGALESIVDRQGLRPGEVLVRLYFERGATVEYTVGVYDALTRAGFRAVQWGLEQPEEDGRARAGHVR